MFEYEPVRIGCPTAEVKETIEGQLALLCAASGEPSFSVVIQALNLYAENVIKEVPGKWQKSCQ